MNISSIELKQFKRFSDLKILDIPNDTKLVLLIGANGSGKSSIFDSFDYASRNNPTYGSFQPYFQKNEQVPEVLIKFTDGESIDISSGKKQLNSSKARRFFGRSSLRIVPRINNSGNSHTVKTNQDAPLSFIDPDIRFNNDLSMFMQSIDNALREPVFKGQSADTLLIFQEFIQPINASLLNIFNGEISTTIQLAEFENPSTNKPGRLVFKKGDSKINYDLLSHGEKQVIILLLNFVVRKEFYRNSIIYIDEMDLHMNTALQYNLLSEIVSAWIPDDSQFWTATHALGFIDFAKKSSNSAIIDLDQLNFDLPQLLYPARKENMDVYDVAIPKETIGSILKGYKLVVVENQNDQHYNLVLGPAGFLFLPAQNNREVFLTIKSDPSILGLRDKDFLRVDEVHLVQAKYPNLLVLAYYAFENYIYHPDNIEELKFEDFNKADYTQEILDQKFINLLKIVGSIGTSRQTYPELKDAIKDDKNIEPIIDALKSDDLETFYPYFNMKAYYNKNYLQKYRYTIKDLVSTDWFKTQILSLLSASSQ